MGAPTLGLIELLLVVVVVIGGALWNIRSTARALRETRRRAEDEQQPPGAA